MLKIKKIKNQPVFIIIPMKISLIVVAVIVAEDRRRRRRRRWKK